MGVTESCDMARVVKMVEALAAEHLTPLFGKVTGSAKADGSLLTEADLAMQSSLVEALNGCSPGIPVLAEEQSEEEQRRLLGASGQGVWCLDPLDGTTNFTSGVPLFAVSLALIGAGGVEFGLVHDPSRQESFTAIKGKGAWLNGKRLVSGAVPGSLADCVAVVDFKRLPGPLATRLAVSPPFRSQRSFGSVALDWCWLASGRCQLYLHGGQRLWDYAAGQLIAREAGVAVCLGASVEGDCEFRVSLAPRVGTGASNAGLMRSWQSWLRQE